MIFSASALIRKRRNAAASFWCFDCFETAKPSPAYWTTPFCGLLVKGGRNGATFEPIAFCSVAVSQFPSMIIAASPFMKAPRMFVFVSTSLFVQPCFGRFAQVETCLTTFGDVHGIPPVYSPFHWAGE